ncbi:MULTISPECIES: sigma-70 family RNA polymerase sigma factor [unclassified Oceanobacter]|uniref:sigma-70 family RNA polymerase sigma factor n=1 Tax=unclassified Oceanobacter TaxID=2620260 RepID=UPI0026E22DA1|nr:MULTISPECIES: sigma-70 family RNA polymerase sigma factor [unclassified Oceanobacter]MDO6682457.1 sigma-70 family RNA polymerase sigma factor [Oceanobacter sp. 5_MG-2023]MDP2506403.1 sigma-70 family RNA polymerase sigma factor [Oceanobacter sp. 3_MG-2023]
MQSTTSEREALSLLYTNHHHWLRNWLNQRMGSSERAADLAHDTFIRVLLNHSQLHSLREPRAYLKTIASRLLIDDSRKRRVEQAWIEAWTEFNQEDACSCSAETQAEVTELLTALVRMLEGLPEKVRNAFIWSRLEGLTYADIAQRLNVSHSSVKQYIASAMLHCYDLLEN